MSLVIELCLTNAMFTRVRLGIQFLGIYPVSRYIQNKGVSFTRVMVCVHTGTRRVSVYRNSIEISTITYPFRDCVQTGINETKREKAIFLVSAFQKQLGYKHNCFWNAGTKRLKFISFCLDIVAFNKLLSYLNA